MSTLLTTSKMAPELVLRIEASVSGRRGARSRGVVRLRLATWFRLATFAALVVAVASFVRLRRLEHEQLENARSKLLATVKGHAAALTPDELRIVARVDPWLMRASGPYEGDLVANELEVEGALSAVLSRPALYVRGPTKDFQNTRVIATTSATSLKDPFVLCLLDPPASRAEKAVLTKVHAAYSGGAHLETPTANVRRLFDAEAGLPLLMPEWAGRVRTAEDAVALGHLEHELGAAPLEAAKKAAKAQILLFAMDDPGDSGGLSELDGERPHDVRVGLVDLRHETVLLRLRKHVDPAWISLPKRAQYASGLDGCALALDVRTSVVPAGN
ncbi:MAG TPA: hypothetical protein VF395_19650 [Polyangiaceae bacterium]